MTKPPIDLRQTPEYLEHGYQIITCPVCGNETLDTYWICRHCNWEYDGTTDENEYSDCNSGTITQYRAKYRQEKT